jgi:hypothetical protein
MPINWIVAVLLDLCGIGCLVVLTDVLFLALVRSGRVSRHPRWSALSLFLWFLLGFPALWMTLRQPLTIRVVTSLLYISGCLIYIQLRSLLSRGYSLRILIDLRRSGGQAELATLKSIYGGGMGVSGLISKRLRSLSDFGVVSFQENRLGPLTTTGKIMAWVGLRLRGWLCLRHVG